MLTSTVNGAAIAKSRKPVLFALPSLPLAVALSRRPLTQQQRQVRGNRLSMLLSTIRPREMGNGKKKRLALEVKASGAAVCSVSAVV